MSVDWTCVSAHCRQKEERSNEPGMSGLVALQSSGVPGNCISMGAMVPHDGSSMDQPCSPTGVNKAGDIGGVLAEQRESAGVAGVKMISEPVESMDSRGVSG